MNSLQELLLAIAGFINATLIPFLFVIAFLAFIVNVFRYFILGGVNQTAQENARKYATWSIAAFVIMVSIWGIINMIASSLGFCRSGAVQPDYFGKSYDVSIPCSGIPLPSSRPSGYDNSWY